MKINLPQITLVGVDCLNIQRLVDVARICQKNISFGSVKLFTSQKHSDPNIVKIENLNYSDVSKFLIKELFKYIETDFVLIIQHDGFILNHLAWTNVFLHFDYVGAPWWYHDGLNVGNGGFSLRSKKLCSILAEDESITQFHPEDLHISRTYRKQLEKKGIRFAPEIVARKFSFEGNPKQGLKWNGQFGFHHYWLTNIDNWSILKNTNLFFDMKFIFRFLINKRKRTKNKAELNTIQKYLGMYTSSDFTVSITIKFREGNLLVTRNNQKRYVYNYFGGLTFFHDSNEELIEFRQFRNNLVLILHFRESTGKFSSIYLKKSK